ncbi:MAG: hypothetical protein LBP72_04490 [Dysgonamonadaceae bacterium]|nr:hypothetical protein [Dysgonamonadaceae bacterium]
MIEYGTQELNDKALKIPNPTYVRLSYQIKKNKEKRARLEAKLYNKIDPENTASIDQLKKVITHEDSLINQINDFTEAISYLIRERKLVEARISISTPRTNCVVKKLCDDLNKNPCFFPFTNLKLFYDSLAF